FCDPLELKADSSLGVPGLVEAARAGRVVLANPLGGAVVEAPGMAAFLPGLCRSLLAEDLLLPGVPTHWCGTAAGRRAALAALDRSVVRDAFDSSPLFARGSTARLGAAMDRAARARLAAEMERRGATLAVQEVLPPCLAPTLEGARLVPRPVALRVFAAWTPDGYVVLPGGLARVGQGDGERATLSMQSGAAGKDVWVVSDRPADRFSLLRPKSEPLPIRRVGDEPPSRALDNLLWLGRYAERSEALARTIRAVVRRLGDDAGPDAGGAPELARRLLIPYAQASEAAVAAAEAGDGAALAREMLALAGDRNHPYGLVRTFAGVRRTAWSVRDRLSLDHWRSILALTGDEGEAPGDLVELAARLDMLIRRSAALSGLSAENMTRGPNWLFLDLGRRIERGVGAAWVARQLVGEPGERAVERMQMALEIADSAMTYRFRYLGTFQAPPVLDLLLLDESNPRSAAYQIATLARHLAELREDAAGGPGEEDGIVPLLVRLRRSDPAALAGPAAVAALSDAVGRALQGLSDALADRYFRPSPRRRTGSAPRGEGT
ncbi:alpha-E domain-containing protein, partial [Stella sp.]|uniref:alpha-E domain-containing protein n=1 Tax=Stella sp. TaxID=2912054 RepID=UPI0035ADF6C7